MRPVYESDEDRARELLVMSRLVAATMTKDRVAVKTPKFYPIDFAVCGIEKPPRIRSLYELKCRKTYYSTWRVAATKVIAAREFEGIGIPCFLSWALAEKDRWRVAVWRVDTSQIEDYLMAGREDRGDPNDIEPMVVVPDSACTIWRV